MRRQRRPPGGRGAFARLGPGQQKLFHAYQLSGWNARRCAARLQTDELSIHAGCSPAFRALGIAFRIEITGETEGADEDAFF